MGRHRAYGPGDEELKLDGDEFWRGVEMRVHPSKLASAFAAEAVNMRFTNGVPETRPGTVKLPWTNKLENTEPLNGVFSWGTVYGRGNFKATLGANEVQWHITAADGDVYASRSNNVQKLVPLPAGVTITSRVTFVQANNTLIMFRGLDLVPLVMTDIVAGFSVRPATDAGPLSSSMPNGLRGIWTANRLWVQTANDQVWGSDSLEIFDYSEAGKFKINQGSVDPLVTIALFGKEIIALKKRSVFRIANITGLLTEVSVQPVTRRYGCIAPESVVDWGSDMGWLTENREIATLTLTEVGEIQTAEGSTKRPEMFSDPIAPLMRRIHAQYASGAVGAFWERKFYLAVPLDNATALRDELAPRGVAVQGALSTALVPTEAGRTYRWVKGVSENSLTNGTQTLTQSGDFTAQGTSITLNYTPPKVVTASVKQIFKGVNTAILVYDFQNEAWAGHDEANGLEVKEFFLAENLGRDRLFTVGFDGWVTLYEEGSDDAVSRPYVDVRVANQPQTNDSIKVNTLAITITANAAASLNLGHSWATAPSTNHLRAAKNLFMDDLGNGGYFKGALNPFESGPVQVVRLVDALPHGVRFISMNGLMPFVETTGNWPQITRVQRQAIPTRLVTRGYRAPGGLVLSRVKGLEMHIQTWAPSYSGTVKAEGVSEETTPINGQTRDRTRYTRPFNAPAYDETNVNNDFLAPHREDYSVVARSAGFFLGSGIRFDQMQDQHHRVQVTSGLTRAPQLVITNVAGRIRVLACGVEGFEASRRKGVLT